MLPPRPTRLQPVGIFEDEMPTDASARSTKRPPSQPEISDTERLLGKVMASQASLRAAWESRNAEHSTMRSEVIALTKCVKDVREDVHTLLKSQATTSKRVQFATRAAPIVITIIEVARAVIQHYTGLGG